MNRTRFLLLGLLLALLLPGASARSAPLAAPGQSAFGVNSHIGSRFPDPSRMNIPADALAQAETGWVREDFQFARINPTSASAFEWDFTDNAVKELQGRGINIIGVLNGPTPSWATPGNPDKDFFPPDPQAFATFASAVVARYGDRIKYWEVWNEPDNGLYWKPTPNAAAYAQLLKTTAPAIKAAYPGMRVLSAGLVTPYPAITFLAEIANNGAWDSFDIVSIHPYTDPKGPEEGQIGPAGVEAVRALVNQRGAKPLWATEFGWSTGPGGRENSSFDEETQANYLVRGALLLRAAGVERVLVYNLKDDPEQKYGLFRYGSGNGDYSSFKPSFVAFKTLNQQLGATSSPQRIDLTPPQNVFDFENFGSWRRGDQPNGDLTQTSAQVHSGRFAGQLRYNFPSGGNDYVVFSAGAPPTIPSGATQLGIWVYGDGQGHTIKVWLRDAEGEVLQFRMGPVGAAGWHTLLVPITGQVPSYDQISGARNGRLDLPARVQAFVLDDEPDSFVGSGTVYLDDMFALSGAESYGVRSPRGDGSVVDAIWSTTGGAVSVATASGQGTLVDRSGGAQTVSASGGQFTINVGPSPVYLIHTPGNGTVAPPAPPAPPDAPPAPPAPPVAPPPGSAPTPAPIVSPPSANDRCFPETGFCIGGRIRQFWEQNGGLPVFGLPITPLQTQTIEGQSLQVQWFERNRLELHPENARPYDVLLGRLSADVLAAQSRDWMQFPKGTAQDGCQFFAQTGHSVCGDILKAWRASGLELDGRAGKTASESLALFGLPLSEPQTETLSDGKQYTVQWFERARFELHPENQPPYNVLLGLLGNEVLKR